MGNRERDSEAGRGQGGRGCACVLGARERGYTWVLTVVSPPHSGDPEARLQAPAPHTPGDLGPSARLTVTSRTPDGTMSRQPSSCSRLLSFRICWGLTPSRPALPMLASAWCPHMPCTWLSPYNPLGCLRSGLSWGLGVAASQAGGSLQARDPNGESLSDMVH